MESTRKDNFGNDIANPLTDLLSIPGHHDFTPERLRVYRNGDRIFLQYGDDSHYTETDTGRTLKPDEGDVMTVETAQRISYPVGNDIVASMAWGVDRAPEAGDVVAGGYGDPDITNFDPDTKTYTASNADGYFWYLCPDLGLTDILLAEVRDGTILYSTTKTLGSPADVWNRFAQWLNWYDVGPCRFIETYTDVVNREQFPQFNRPLGAVANDDGKGPLHGSKRMRLQVYRDTGTNALAVESGSFGVLVPGNFEYLFKEKFHVQAFDVTDTTDDSYEVVGAIRSDPDRPLIHSRLLDVEVVSTPSTSTNCDILVVSVDPSSTNLSDSDFSSPRERSATNSVIQAATDNTATGPDSTASGTDASGAVTAETVSEIAGYQLGGQIVRSQGSGIETEQRYTQAKSMSRDIYDTDVALVLIDSDEAGIHETKITIAENN
jgi:hypothetical protein